MEYDNTPLRAVNYRSSSPVPPFQSLSESVTATLHQCCLVGSVVLPVKLVTGPLALGNSTASHCLSSVPPSYLVMGLVIFYFYFDSFFFCCCSLLS
ncbi:hypothetical protein BDV30DRAFT_212559 [Aspergillus minisclerotigenes]|uniref:Uncharacterized protein n=1 Tax=Aspergillus minisclerotigenes TaxID=656917 RepID=A0A5N6J317_9EURO|nr:hypothetical protein BDV30DRAFT_212559 [Aspergillus minisclerotigenes]